MKTCLIVDDSRVVRKVASADKTVLILPRSAHIVTRDYDRDVLRAAIRKFVVRVAGLASPAGP